MKISEMHELFRVLAQRMGLQDVRGIIPEEIDILLNNAINLFIKNVLKENAIVVFQDSKTKANIFKNGTPVGYLNALRTLYSSDSYKAFNSKKVMYYLSFACIKNDKSYKARLVEADKVDEMEMDYCSRASLEYPIVTLSNDKGGFNINIYPKDIFYSDVIIRYLKYPEKVKYDEDEESNSVDCDLPEYTHDDIVTLAATQYIQSLNITTKQ